MHLLLLVQSVYDVFYIIICDCLDINATNNTNNTNQSSQIITNSNLNSTNKNDETFESGRPRRQAYTHASERLTQQVNVSLKDKIRRDVNIKTERISVASSESIPVKNVKQEPIEMPPPAALPKRGGRKKKEPTIKVERASTRTTRMRNTNVPAEVDDNANMDSDVVLVQDNIATISLDSVDEEVIPTEEELEVDEAVESAPESKTDTPPASANKKKARSRQKTESATRTKKTSKRSRSPSSETKKTTSRTRRSKRKKSTPSKSTDTSLYEDAVEPPAGEIIPAESPKHLEHDDEIVVQLPTVALDRLSKDVLSSIEHNPNATITISKTAIMNETVTIQAGNPSGHPTTMVLNSTVTISKPTQKETLPTVDDIMTDDESDIEEKPPVPVTKKVGKQLFNPFENSPVKKKVEAFEKLGAKAVEPTTTRVTRTKSRQKAKAAEEAKKLEDDTDESPTAGKTKIPGFVTPVASNRALPSMTSGKSNLSSSAQKALSAIKMSTQHFRDYEQKRKEKEAEAQKKKDAYLLKLSEDKRRKREEKEQKAKLQRAALEEEKKRALEQQLAREERHKQQLQEKQDRLNKQREDAEKRRILAKQKHEELKKEEERKRADELRALKKREEDEKRKAEEDKRQQVLKARQIQKELEMAERQLASLPKSVEPLYMTQKAPLMPTPDCYDSDDEDAPKNIKLQPWNSREALHPRLRAMSFIDAKVSNTLFCVKAQTPDLQELFPNLDPKKLRRNSSAIWKQAPRFTMMPELNEDF